MKKQNNNNKNYDDDDMMMIIIIITNKIVSSELGFQLEQLSLKYIFLRHLISQPTQDKGNLRSAYNVALYM